MTDDAKPATNEERRLMFSGLGAFGPDAKFGNMEQQRYLARTLDARIAELEAALRDLSEALRPGVTRPGEIREAHERAREVLSND